MPSMNNYIDTIREDIYCDKLIVQNVYEKGIHKVDVVKHFSVREFDWITAVTLDDILVCHVSTSTFADFDDRLAIVATAVISTLSVVDYKLTNP